MPFVRQFLTSKLWNHLSCPSTDSDPHGSEKPPKPTTRMIQTLGRATRKAASGHRALNSKQTNSGDFAFAMHTAVQGCKLGKKQNNLTRSICLSKERWMPFIVRPDGEFFFKMRPRDFTYTQSFTVPTICKQNTVMSLSEQNNLHRHGGSPTLLRTQLNAVLLRNWKSVSKCVHHTSLRAEIQPLPELEESPFSLPIIRTLHTPLSNERNYHCVQIFNPVYWIRIPFQVVSKRRRTCDHTYLWASISLHQSCSRSITLKKAQRNMVQWITEELLLVDRVECVESDPNLTMLLPVCLRWWTIISDRMITLDFRKVEVTQFNCWGKNKIVKHCQPMSAVSVNCFVETYSHQLRLIRPWKTHTQHIGATVIQTGLMSYTWKFSFCGLLAIDTTNHLHSFDIASAWSLGMDLENLCASYCLLKNESFLLKVRDVQLQRADDIKITRTDNFQPIKNYPHWKGTFELTTNLIPSPDLHTLTETSVSQQDDTSSFVFPKELIEIDNNLTGINQADDVVHKNSLTAPHCIGWTKSSLSTFTNSDQNELRLAQSERLETNPEINAEFGLETDEISSISMNSQQSLEWIESPYLTEPICRRVISC